MTQPEKKKFLVEGACQYFGITTEELCHPNGKRSKIWNKKRFFVSILYDYTDASYSEIARILNYATHVNVSHHYKTIKEELSDEFYNSQKTKMIYNELLTYLNLNGNENKDTNSAEKTRE
jgi:chromosomal replication initiation ATPase DnaA